MPRRPPKRQASYLIIPKGKRLAKKVVEKLERDNYRYVIATAVEAAKRLQDKKKKSIHNKAGLFDDDESESKGRHSKRGSSFNAWRQEKVRRIVEREEKRIKRRELARKEELRRKKYRVHPDDEYHIYLEGYTKKRHRITKKRFMRCIDVPLFKEVLNLNMELVESPIWDDDLNLRNLTFARARVLKDHLQQFEVLIEALKQGIFNRPGCDDIPIERVRRKKKPSASEQGQVTRDSNAKGSQPSTKKIRDRYKPKAKYQMKEDVEAGLSTVDAAKKRRLSFPPLKSDNEHGVVLPPTKAIGWLTKIDGWLKQTNQVPEQGATTGEPSKSLPEEKASVMSFLKKALVKKKTSKSHDGESRKSYGRRKSVVFGDEERRRSKSLPGESKRLSDEENKATAEKQPLELEKLPANEDKVLEKSDESQVRRSRHSSVAEQVSKSKNQAKANAIAVRKKLLKEKEKARPPHVPKYDPLQRLHQDEKESDVWTMTTTTTTDGYASWRRPPHVDKRKLDEEEDWTETDRTFICRIVLVLIVLWEASYFVENQLDNVYFTIFTSHLYRENIWPVRPGLFPINDTDMSVHFQEWVHFIISVISLSIIHKENECVSLLFASSLLIDGNYKVGIVTHDSLFLAHGVSWASVALNTIHLFWKALIICLFVAYHFYSADYIRKTREFKHRKTKIHNHEIIAKGIKGLQKRKLAWDWMVLHARKTNTRALCKKFPDVKDGNFPSEDLAKEIKFDQSKELRLYAQEHNLNIVYPYNKLRDMKRYVFGELEKSDYSSDYEERRRNRRWSTLADPTGGGRKSRPRPTYVGLTKEKYEEWKKTDGKQFKKSYHQPRRPTERVVVEKPKPPPVTHVEQRFNSAIGGFGLTLGPKMRTSIANLKKDLHLDIG